MRNRKLKRANNENENGKREADGRVFFNVSYLEVYFAKV